MAAKGMDLSKGKTQICQELEKKLRDLDTEYLLALAKTKIPNGAVKKPNVTPLTTGPLFPGMAMGG